MNFILKEMTFLRYFMPLIIEGNKRNLKSHVYWAPSGKYNCPRKYLSNLQSLSKEYNFELIEITKPIDREGLVFVVEGVGRDYAQSNKQIKISLAFMTNYMSLWQGYWNEIDFCILPSKYFVETSGIPEDKKFLLLGCPKYDVELINQNILEKYNLPNDKKYAFVLLPKYRDLKRANLKFIYNFLRGKEYKIITKTRGKDDYPGGGDFNFKDFSWFPHDSMELMKISDLVVNFDSAAIKECVMLEKKVINFRVKPFTPKFLELYHEGYCAKIEKKLSWDAHHLWDHNQLSKQHEKIIATPPSSFQEIKNKYLFEPGSSKRILDHFNV